jgi:hypothetical protein
LVAVATGIDEGGDAMGKFSLGPAPAAATLALLSALGLAGCGSFGGFPSFGSSTPAPEPVPVEPQQAPEIPASIRSSEVIGRWG